MEVRTLTVTPEFWKDMPEQAGKVVARHMDKYPDAFWIVLVAKREDARSFMETQLFHMAPSTVRPGETP